MTAQPTHIETSWDVAPSWLNARTMTLLEAWTRGAMPSCAHRTRVTLGPPDVTFFDLSGPEASCIECLMDHLAGLSGDWVDGRTCDDCGQRLALVTTFACPDASPAIVLLVALCERCVPGATNGRRGASA